MNSFIFLLYCSLPVFHSLTPYILYTNLVKLVIFTEILLSPEIKNHELEVAQNIIIEFLKELANLYDSSIMLSGFHELIHLVDCTLEFGPLNQVNCFPFEELNRKFERLIKGKDLIGEEFIKIFTAVQSLNSIKLYKPNNTKLYEFINEHLEQAIKKRTSNKKNLFGADVSHKILSSLMTIKNRLILKAYVLYFKKPVNELIAFTKLKYHGHLYTSFNEKSRQNDAAFITSKGQYGLINFLIEEENTIYVIAQKISNVFNPFFCSLYPERKSCLSICHITDEYFIEKIDEIKKVFLMNISGGDCFISKFRSSHLFL